MTTDLELVDMLDEVWSSVAELGGTLTEDDWKRVTECPGWSVQDVLVHLTALEAFLLGRPLPMEDLPDDLPHVKNDKGRANERWIASRRNWTGADALAEFRSVTSERVAGLRALSPADFGAESWTPMGPGTVRTLLPFRIFDSWVHDQDMRRAVGCPGDLDSVAAAYSLAMMFDTMPYVIGKKVGAPDGSTVVFSLTGPLARTVAIGVVDGRARVLGESPPTPTVGLTLDSESFERLACGRIDPHAVLAAGTVSFAGDATLGQRVVEELNYMF